MEYMSLVQVVIIIAALLIVANGMLDGAVEEGLKDIATNEEKQELRNSLTCTAGLLMYPPVKNVWGVDVPIPSFDDLLFSFVITGVILFLMNLINLHQTWKAAVIIFVVVWFAFRLTGLLLIKTSGVGCEDAMQDMAGLLDGMYTLSALLGLGILYKVIKAWRHI
jgi:hypothetical protein